MILNTLWPAIIPQCVSMSAVTSVVTASSINILLPPSSDYMSLPVFVTKEVESPKTMINVYQTIRHHINIRSHHNKKLKYYFLKLNITQWNSRWNRCCVAGGLHWLLTCIVITGVTTYSSIGCDGHVAGDRGERHKKTSNVKNDEINFDIK
jgi:hypothetical protein